MLRGNDPAQPHAADAIRGLTVREHFAALALQGLAANPQYEGATAGEMARAAAQLADALVAELAGAEAQKRKKPR